MKIFLERVRTKNWLRFILLIFLFAIAEATMMSHDLAIEVVGTLGVAYLILTLNQPKMKRHSWYFYPIVIALAVMAIFVISVIIGIIRYQVMHGVYAGHNQDAINATLRVNKTHLVPLVLQMSILAPIIEELVFRAGFIGKFRIKVFPHFDLILSSLIFGYLHVLAFNNIGDWLNLASYTLMGFIFGLVYLKTENIWCSIGTHIAYNSLVTVALVAMI